MAREYSNAMYEAEAAHDKALARYMAADDAFLRGEITIEEYAAETALMLEADDALSAAYAAEIKSRRAA